MKRLSNRLLSTVFILVLAGCGGGGTPANTPSSGVLIMGGADLINSTYSASIRVTNSNAGGATIADAIVAVNGVPLPYNPVTQWYGGNIVAPDPSSGKFNFSVMANGVTYSATESALTSVPVVTMPATFSAASVNPISWTAPGGASTNTIYSLDIALDDGSFTSVYTTGWTQSTSVNVPSSKTVAGTKYVVTLTAAKLGAPIANAASGSNLTVNAYSQQLNFTAAP